MIKPEQLVAINTNTNPPEIVWRWLRAAVIEVSNAIVVVDDMQGHPAKVTLVPDLPLTLTLDHEVWTCGTVMALKSMTSFSMENQLTPLVYSNTSRPLSKKYTNNEYIAYID